MVPHQLDVAGGRVAEAGSLGATQTFEAFFHATHRRLFTALCLVCGDRHEAEEVAQDAYLKIFERWERVAAMDAPESYLFRTAMNLFRSRYRRAALAMRRAVSLAPAPVDALAAVETRDEVVRVLRQLAHGSGPRSSRPRSSTSAPTRPGGCWG
jgi:DNA-directed RNA polymerase specialized sigma24 family protein